jgi:thymidylate synthase (FAD)
VGPHQSNDQDPITRVSVPELDAILGRKYPLLDDGFVRLVDYMGNDGAIVQAARTSYGKGTETKSTDEGLIRYLFRHAHTTPFEMCEIKLHIRCPMDLWRQWIRHRTASVNEYSTRYSLAIDEKCTTPPTDWRLQSKSNKQGSSGENVEDWPDNPEKYGLLQQNGVPPGKYLSQREADVHALAKDVYEERIAFGVAREVARKDLPLSTYTEAYWKCNLYNLMHFLSLRMEKHAQLEIRQYATVIGEQMVARWVPLAWNAFNDYHFRRGAMLLSSRDKVVLTCISRKAFSAARLAAKEYGWLELRQDMTLKDNRERKEFEDKISDILPIESWKEVWGA